MLGKLAKWLRALGYDVVYLRAARDAETLAMLQQGRVLLTRDRRAKRWREQGNVFVITKNDPKEQLREVVKGLDLSKMDDALFSRCLDCNHPLSRVGRAAIREEIPEYIWQKHYRFYRCEECNKVYWPGSHSERMRHRVEEIFSNSD
jgi:uncharacterized protein with PIN domain